jgi:hypothetical protein
VKENHLAFGLLGLGFAMGAWALVLVGSVRGAISRAFGG